MKTTNKTVFVLTMIVLGALALFFALRQEPVLNDQSPVDKNNTPVDGAVPIVDESYCNQYTPEDCPQGCVVCPPCEVCSSIQCRAQSSCAAMGFGENWYKENVTPVETDPLTDAGGGNKQNANAEAANPASVYCVEQGGILEIREGGAGQYGVCVMPDGAECDEWEFFRTKVCGDTDMNIAAAEDHACGIENCHGLEIECGPNPAQVCTEIYQLGDKCRQYAECSIVDGECRQVSNADFDACKSCVQNCQVEFAGDLAQMFECESRCE